MYVFINLSLSYHLVRDLVAAGVVCVEHVSTDNNVADIFIKTLGKIKFQNFAHMLLGYIPVQKGP